MTVKKGRPKKADAPIVPAKVPPAPSALSKEAREIWAIAARDLCQRGVFATIDTYALAKFCRMSDIAAKALSVVEAEGVNISTPQGVRQNPAWRTAKEAELLCIAIARELGLSAAARKRIGAASGATEGDDPVLDGKGI